jgi:hypothetical protein
VRARCGEWCDRIGAQLALRNKCDMHIGLDQNGNPYLFHAISTRGHTCVPSAYLVPSNDTVHSGEYRRPTAPLWHTRAQLRRCTQRTMLHKLSQVRRVPTRPGRQRRWQRRRPA